MKTEFNFLEYSYDPALGIRSAEHRLKILGYVKVGVNKSTSISVWRLNLNIIFLRKENHGLELHLTGLGFLCSQEVINLFDASYDSDIDMYVTVDPNGYRILMYPYSEYLQKKSVISNNFSVTKTKPVINESVAYTSGLVYNDCSDELLSFYSLLNFKISTSGDYAKGVCSGNRFTMVFRNNCIDHKISSIICDTLDVFHSTAYFISKGFLTKKYITPTTENFGTLQHKIIGYNCLADGNKNSYSIENIIFDALPELDFIIRMRKKYLHVKEHTIKEHLLEVI
jgi:hypothetical protein